MLCYNDHDINKIEKEKTMIDIEKLDNATKLSHARLCLHSAKMYAETTDYETALSWALESHRLYSACPVDETVLREKGDCEVALIKISDMSRGREEALKFARYACETYEQLVKIDSSESSKLSELKERRDKLETYVNGLSR